MNTTTAKAQKPLTIEQRLDGSPAADNLAVFDRLWSTVGRLRAKLDARFELQASPANRDVAEFHSPISRARGSLTTFSGPEIDWLVQSWVGDPEAGFINIHLNTWLGPQTRTPHLAIVFGTVPDLFFYLDYVPRTDLNIDLDYLDRYYQPINDQFLDFVEDPKMTPFVSRTLYMRQAISPAGLCFTGPIEQAVLHKAEATADAMLERWLGWMNNPEPVPAADQARLAQRDKVMRRAIAERDPANSLAEKLLGQELTERLVGALWGVASTR
jgi:hypothetical protein